MEISDLGLAVTSDLHIICRVTHTHLYSVFVSGGLFVTLEELFSLCGENDEGCAGCVSFIRYLTSDTRLHVLSIA